MNIVKGIFSLFFFIALFMLTACRSTKDISEVESELILKDSLASQNGKALFVEGLSFYNQQSYKEALDKFNAAETFIVQGSKFTPNDKALLYNSKGKSLFFLGEVDSAAYHFALAQAIAPQYYESYNNSGYLKFIQREYDFAIEDFNKCLSLKPDYAEAIENLKLATEFKLGTLTWDADALFEKAELQKDVDEKIKLYSRLVQLQPNFPDAQNNLGVSLFRADRQQDAVQVFESLNKKHPTYAMGFNNLGFVHESMGHKAQAIELYQKAIALNPEFTLALENLAVVLYDQKEFDQSLKVANRILTIDPTNDEAKNRILLCEKQLKVAKKRK